MSLLSEKYKILNKETFEDLCSVGLTEKQICTVFQKTQQEMDEWCKVNYGNNSFSTVFCFVRQQAVGEYLKAMSEIGQRGNTSAIGIMKELLLNMNEKKNDVVKVVFENNVSREDSKDDNVVPETSKK